MLWLYLTISGYILFALGNTIDRFLLSGPLKHPRVYTFYITVTGIIPVIFIPFERLINKYIIEFDFSIPDTSIIALSFISGALGVYALYLFYSSIYNGKVSTAVPTVGAFVPIFTLIISYALAGNRVEFTSQKYAALIFLVMGTVVLASKFAAGKEISHKKTLFFAMLAAFLFAFSWVIAKFVYDAEDFLNGFIWMRWGAFLTAFTFLIYPETRAVIFKKNPIKNKNVIFPVLAGNTAGATGFFLQSFAIKIATFTQVTFIQSLNGIQHIFIFIFALLVSIKNPALLKEEFTKKSILVRFAGITLIGFGLFFLLS